MIRSKEKGEGVYRVRMEGKKWMEIRGEKKKGLSYSEIGKRHNMDWRTAKKYAETDRQATGVRK